MRPTPKRSLRPRRTDALAVAPIIISDLTCHAVAGLEPRTFKAWLEARKIAHERFGHRVLARAQDVLNAIGSEAPKAQVASTADDDEPGVDDLLARVGRRRA